MKSVSKPERKVLKGQLLRKKEKIKATPEKREMQRQRAAMTKGQKGQNLLKEYR